MHPAGMWIMIWASVSAGGVLSSGALEFPTQEACEAGKRSWAGVTLSLAEKVPSTLHMDARCVQKATGKP